MCMDWGADENDCWGAEDDEDPGYNENDVFMGASATRGGRRTRGGGLFGGPHTREARMANNVMPMSQQQMV